MQKELEKLLLLYEEKFRVLENISTAEKSLASNKLDNWETRFYTTSLKEDKQRNITLTGQIEQIVFVPNRTTPENVVGTDLVIRYREKARVLEPPFKSSYLTKEPHSLNQIEYQIYTLEETLKLVRIQATEKKELEKAQAFIEALFPFTADDSVDQTYQIIDIPTDITIKAIECAVNDFIEKEPNKILSYEIDEKNNTVEFDLALYEMTYRGRNIGELVSNMDNDYLKDTTIETIFDALEEDIEY